MLWDRTMPAEQHGFIKPQKINLYLRFICDAFGWNSLLFAEEFVWVCRTWSLLIYFILKALVSGSFRVWFSRISMCLSFCFFFIICEILERFWILFLSTSLFFSSTHLISFFFFFSLSPQTAYLSHPFTLYGWSCMWKTCHALPSIFNPTLGILCNNFCHFLTYYCSSPYIGNKNNKSASWVQLNTSNIKKFILSCTMFPMKLSSKLESNQLYSSMSIWNHLWHGSRTLNSSPQNCIQMIS